MRFTGYADGSLKLAVDIANSANRGPEEDPLRSPETLEAWLRARGLTGSLMPTSADLEGLRCLRERLGQVFAPGDVDEAPRVLNELLATAAALPQLTDHDGTWHLHFTPLGAPLTLRLTASTAMSLALLIAAGDSDRLRVCAREGCRNVFVDASRNRSRRFCDPATCGNRAHVAAYRARRRARAGAS